MAVIFHQQEYCILCMPHFVWQQAAIMYWLFAHQDLEIGKMLHGDAKRGVLPLNEASNSHKDTFKDVCDDNLKDIHCSIFDQHDKQVKWNREILLFISEVIITLGKQNIPFQSHSSS